MHGDVRLAVVTTTLPTEDAAHALAADLLERRLAACVQTMPIRSIYRWKDQLESANEILLVAKTRAELAADLMNVIRDSHPYETPEIVLTPVEAAHPPYSAWVAQETLPVRLA